MNSDDGISAAYVEQQYPGQPWLPASDETLQAFLANGPRLGKDAKGRTCLLPAAKPRPLPKSRRRNAALPPRAGDQSSSMTEAGYALAARFVAALYEDSQHEPLPWRWVADTAKRAGIWQLDQVERALSIAQVAGLLIVNDGSSVTLTMSGLKAARRSLLGTGHAQADLSAITVKPPTSSHNIQV